MSQCANGTNRLFFFAKSFPGAPIKVTRSKSPVSPAYPKRFWIAPKRFLPIWKLPAALGQNQNAEEESRQSRCRNRRSRSWISYKRQRSRTGSGHLSSADASSAFCDKLCREYGH